MADLVFGNVEQIAMRKSRKKKTPQAELPMVISPGAHEINFSLCKTCLKNVHKRGYSNISTVFPHLCTDCRTRFMDLANREMIIGGSVNIH